MKSKDKKLKSRDKKLESKYIKQELRYSFLKKNPKSNLFCIVILKLENELINFKIIIVSLKVNYDIYFDRIIKWILEKIIYIYIWGKHG